ncbi:hypothetical protein ACH5RR_025648, partial [Cinchona calisaya]
IVGGWGEDGLLKSRFTILPVGNKSLAGSMARSTAGVTAVASVMVRRQWSRLSVIGGEERGRATAWPWHGG